MIQRVRLPDGTEHDVNLGPCGWVPIHGHSHRPHVITGGSFVRPDPGTSPADRRRAQVRHAAARYRAKARAAG